MFLLFQLIFYQKDDPTLNQACVLPPNCLSLDKLRECATKHAGNKTTAKAPLGPAVHIHNHFASPTNPLGSRPALLRGSKHAHSLLPDSSSDDTESESLPLADILADLDMKYPKLCYPQYEPTLEEHGIVYAESVAEFPQDFFRDLGMAEGAIGPFLKGTQKALLCEKRVRKQVRMEDKENQFSRVPSVEL